MITENQNIFQMNICETILADIWYKNVSSDTPYLLIFSSAIFPPLAQKLSFQNRPPKNKHRRSLQPFSYKSWRLQQGLQVPLIRAIQNWIYSSFILSLFTYLMFIWRSDVAFFLLLLFILLSFDFILQLICIIIRYRGGFWTRLTFDHILSLSKSVLYFVGLSQIKIDPEKFNNDPKILLDNPYSLLSYFICLIHVVHLINDFGHFQWTIQITKQSLIGLLFSILIIGTFTVYMELSEDIISNLQEGLPIMELIGIVTSLLLLIGIINHFYFKKAIGKIFDFRGICKMYKT